MNTQSEGEVIIRRFERKDRVQLRCICYETANGGQSMAVFFHDRELLADLVTRYYTDFEPESVWVAEHAGRVEGYLTGCCDTQRYRNIMAARIVPAAALAALGRGVLLKGETWRLLFMNFVPTLQARTQWQVPLQVYPAHLHVNLLAELRGRRIGERLVEKFAARVLDLGLKGIHVNVREDNRRAVLFFERIGFEKINRMFLMKPERNTIWYSTVLGRMLE